jgi:hypothetical protein
MLPAKQWLLDRQSRPLLRTLIFSTKWIHQILEEFLIVLKIKNRKSQRDPKNNTQMHHEA